MFGLGTQELIIILVLVLMIFGAGKLPQVGSALGKGLRNLKDGLKDVTEEKEEENKPAPLEKRKEDPSADLPPK
ncbi:MAG TPA: twin-arginine translocase TatA/TatE family subunit [Desulfuromonadales bacterium]|nr:twin-arginine translocase TatA/TatE family subunit [Desulfuromonadales bacterium]